MPRKLDTPAEAVELESRLKRDRVPKDWRSPFADGLADWPALIQGMEQRRIDAVLGKVNTHREPKR